MHLSFNTVSDTVFPFNLNSSLIGERRSQQASNICINLYIVGPTSSTLVQHCTHVIQMFCIHWAAILLGKWPNLSCILPPQAHMTAHYQSDVTSLVAVFTIKLCVIILITLFVTSSVIPLSGVSFWVTWLTAIHLICNTWIVSHSYIPGDVYILTCVCWLECPTAVPLILEITSRALILVKVTINRAFGLVEMVISTNPNSTIYRSVDTDRHAIGQNLHSCTWVVWLWK